MHRFHAKIIQINYFAEYLKRYLNQVNFCLPISHPSITEIHNILPDLPSLTINYRYIIFTHHQSFVKKFEESLKFLRLEQEEFRNSQILKARRLTLIKNSLSSRRICSAARTHRQGDNQGKGRESGGEEGPTVVQQRDHEVQTIWLTRGGYQGRLEVDSWDGWGGLRSYAELRPALGCVSRAHPASTRACALSPLPVHASLEMHFLPAPSRPL